MHDQLDIQSYDAEMLAEIEMTTELIIVASSSRERLSEATVNQLLGLGVRTPQAARQ